MRNDSSSESNPSRPRKACETPHVRVPSARLRGVLRGVEVFEVVAEPEYYEARKSKLGLVHNDGVTQTGSQMSKLTEVMFFIVLLPRSN